MPRKSFFWFMAAMKGEEEEVKKEQQDFDACVGVSECVILLLSGEACITIDLRFWVMVIPLGLLQADFLDELGLFLH